MDEVLKYANEGGDTEPETGKMIAARNAKMQEMHDASTEAAKTIAEATQKAYDQHLAAVDEIMGDGSEPNLSGAPVPPSADAPKKPSAKASA